MGLFSSIGKVFKKVASVALPVVGAATGQPWLTAAGTAVGGLMDNSAKKGLADDANQLSLYMSNTAHQREVADLRAAGLNPILSANAGASTPTAQVAGYSDQATNGLNAALQVAQVRAAIENMKADTAKKISEQQTTDNIGAKTVIEFENLKKQGRLLDAQLPEAVANANLYNSDAGDLIKAIDKIAPGAGSLINSAKGLKGLATNPGFKLPLKGKL